MPPPGLQSKHKLREHIILFPDHTFQDWQEDETPGWAALQYLMLKAADLFPWAGRLSQVFFRGSSKTGEGLLWAGAHARLAGAACSMTDAGAILCCTAHKLELSLQCFSRSLTLQPVRLQAGVAALQWQARACLCLQPCLGMEAGDRLVLFQPQTNCAARCAGNRGIIEPYELGTYDGLDVKVWDWGPDVTRCGPEVVLVD